VGSACTETDLFRFAISIQYRLVSDTQTPVIAIVPRVEREHSVARVKTLANAVQYKISSVASSFVK